MFLILSPVGDLVGSIVVEPLWCRLELSGLKLAGMHSNNLICADRPQDLANMLRSKGYFVGIPA